MVVGDVPRIRQAATVIPGDLFAGKRLHCPTRDHGTDIIHRLLSATVAESEKVIRLFQPVAIVEVDLIIMITKA